MSKDFHCIVCGETCIDLPIKTVDRETPLSSQGTLLVEPIQPGTGGIVPNGGIAMAKMGLRTAAFGCVGDDDWANMLESRLTDAGLNTDLVVRSDRRSTSVTAILVDNGGEHTFAFHPGASALFNAELVRHHIDVFERSEFALFGYYGLFDEFAQELPILLKHIQSLGCRTAMDAAAGGGNLQPLDRILPFLDIYVPSLDEAKSQTGCSDPIQMIECFRQFAPNSLLGIKLGAEGAVLSEGGSDELIQIPPVTPGSEVIDTTGAGDCFYAGLICGLVNGMSVRDAGRLAAAAGSCAVTEFGATAGLPDFNTLCRMANISGTS